MVSKVAYKEIEAKGKNSSWLCLLDNKVASYFVYIFQNAKFTANQITFFSFLLVFVGILSLFVGSKLLFVFFMFLSYTFDNIDGIWARLKNQTSSFGIFFDPYLDKAKDFFIDIAFVFFYYEIIKTYVVNEKIILFAVSLYLIVKGLFYMVRDHYLAEQKKHISGNRSQKVTIFSYGGAEKFFIVYTLISLNFYFFVFYIGAHFVIYFVGIVQSLIKFFRLENEKLVS